jgi:hypothetical protein
MTTMLGYLLKLTNVASRRSVDSMSVVRYADK